MELQNIVKLPDVRDRGAFSRVFICYYLEHPRKSVRNVNK